MAKAPGNVKTLKNSSPAFFLFQENIPNRPARQEFQSRLELEPWRCRQTISLISVRFVD
jgi:hypothetical protein